MIAVGKTPPGRFTILMAVALAAVFAPERSFAQTIRTLTLLSESTVRIEGTSNKSDWTADARTKQGTLWLAVGEGGFDPDSLTLTIGAQDLESGRSPIMDRLMYDALKTSEYPNINYSLGASGVERLSASADTTVWDATGILTIAGAVDTVTTQVSGYQLDDGHIAFTGSFPLSMRDYGITPPTALFGALRTRDQVAINFRLVFKDE